MLRKNEKPADPPIQPAAATAEPMVFKQPPHADLTEMERVREHLKTHEAVAVAVGAGTINDLVKLPVREAIGRIKYQADGAIPAEAARIRDRLVSEIDELVTKLAEEGA